MYRRVEDGDRPGPDPSCPGWTGLTSVLCGLEWLQHQRPQLVAHVPHALHEELRLPDAVQAARQLLHDRVVVPLRQGPPRHVPPDLRRTWSGGGRWPEWRGVGDSPGASGYHTLGPGPLPRLVHGPTPDNYDPSVPGGSSPITVSGGLGPYPRLHATVGRTVVTSVRDPPQSPVRVRPSRRSGWAHPPLDRTSPGRGRR